MQQNQKSVDEIKLKNEEMKLPKENTIKQMEQLRKNLAGFEKTKDSVKNARA